jgi:hypothetical protein
MRKARHTKNEMLLAFCFADSHSVFLPRPADHRTARRRHVRQWKEELLFFLVVVLEPEFLVAEQLIVQIEFVDLQLGPELQLVIETIVVLFHFVPKRPIRQRRGEGEEGEHHAIGKPDAELDQLSGAARLLIGCEARAHADAAGAEVQQLPAPADGDLSRPLR